MGTCVVCRYTPWSVWRAYLLHVLRDGVLLEELCALPRVEALRVREELALKVLLVHRQRGALGEHVLLVQTQLHCGGRRRRRSRRQSEEEEEGTERGGDRARRRRSRRRQSEEEEAERGGGGGGGDGARRRRRQSEEETERVGGHPGDKMMH